MDVVKEMEVEQHWPNRIVNKEFVEKEAQEENSVDSTTTSVRELTDIDFEAPLPPLLRLPLELLQLILRHTDVATFYILLSTSKHFLSVAKSRPLLSYQLRRLPGLNLGLDELETEELLGLFQRRTTEGAQAAGVLANTSHYRADPWCMMARASFTTYERHSKYRTLAVPSKSGMIQLFEISRSKVRKREVLYTHHEDGNPGSVQICKMAFSPGTKDLAVLCTQDACPDEECHLFGQRAEGRLARNAITYKLVVFHRVWTKQKGYYWTSSEQDTRDVVFPRFRKVVGLGLAPYGTACIVWGGDKQTKGALVWLVHRNNELMRSSSYDPSPRFTCVIQDTQSMHGLVSHAEFCPPGDFWDLYAAGQPISSWKAELQEDERGILGVVGTQVRRDFDRDGNIQSARRGRTFYTKHSHDARLDDVEEPLCRWTTLFPLYVECNDDSPYAKPSVFIAADESYVDPEACDHITQRGPPRSIRWSCQPLALLGGYRQGSSSLGTVMAISPDGTRVAASNWNCIYLWSLQPSILAEGNLHIYFPRRDYNSKKGFGRLRPTLLSSSAGVVHTMFWQSEDFLYAITDRGLSKFDINGQCQGNRDDLSLNWDAWSTTHLTEPSPGAGQETWPPTLPHEEEDDFL